MKKSLLLGIGALLSVSIWAQSIPDLPIAIGTGSTEVWGNSIYNFVDNIWENAESSPTNVYIGTHGHTIEYLNGFIYLFYNGYTYKYDVSTNTWSQGATNEKGGAWLSSVVYQDEIYPAGWTNGLFYKYSPSSDQWTQLADLPYHVSGGGFDGSHLTLKIFIMWVGLPAVTLRLATHWSMILLLINGVMPLFQLVLTERLWQLFCTKTTFTPSADWTQMERL